MEQEEAKEKQEKQTPDDAELCKSMYEKLVAMDERLKKIEEKLNKQLIG